MKNLEKNYQAGFKSNLQLGNNGVSTFFNVPSMNQAARGKPGLDGGGTFVVTITSNPAGPLNPPQNFATTLNELRNVKDNCKSPTLCE